MKRLILISLLSSGSVVASDFQATLCQHGEQQRKVEVVYPMGTPIPCEVHYTKASGTQVLWKAEGESGFCEAKASALIEKQKGWGWQCEMITPEEPENKEVETQEATPESAAEDKDKE